MRMIDVQITVSVACDEDTTHDQAQEFINKAIDAALAAQPEDARRFEYNGEPFEGWTTA